MPAGLQAFDENGKIVLDVTDSVGVVLGSVNVPSWTGKNRSWSYQIPSKFSGLGKYFIFPAYNSSGMQPGSYAWDMDYNVNITVSAAGVISISATFAANSNMPTFVIYFGTY